MFAVVIHSEYFNSSDPDVEKDLEDGLFDENISKTEILGVYEDRQEAIQFLHNLGLISHDETLNREHGELDEIIYFYKLKNGITITRAMALNSGEGWSNRIRNTKKPQALLEESSVLGSQIDFQLFSSNDSPIGYFTIRPVPLNRTKTIGW